MKISVLGYNSQFIKLQVGNHIISVRVGDVVDVCSGCVTKTCQFCGTEYTKDDYEKTMSEQAPSRDSAHLAFHSTKTCGLYCCYLSNERFCTNTVGNDKTEKMKEDVASRVAKYLENKER